MSRKIKSAIPTARFSRIIPLSLIMYMVAYMDRNNIGFAFDGMSKSLHLSPGLIGTAGGIFFLGYVTLQIPAGYLAERFGVTKLLFFTQIIWGILACCTSLVHSGTQLLVLRFVLGMAEAALYPSLLVLIAQWFPISERARANSLWTLGGPISSLIMGPISGIIVSNFNWQLMFVIEGLPAVIIAFIWIFVMKDSPDKAKWLSKEERNYIETEMAKDREVAQENVNVKSNMWFEILTNPKVWIMCLSYFLLNVGAYGIGLWTPKIIQNLTHSGYTAIGFITILPSAAGILGLYLTPRHSDKTGERKWHAALCMISAGICLLLSNLTAGNVVVSLSFLILTQFCAGGFGAIFWSIPPMFLSKDALGPTAGLINGLGNLGGFFGPMIVGILVGQSGSTTESLLFLGTAYVLCGLSVLTVRYKARQASQVTGPQTAAK